MWISVQLLKLVCHVEREQIWWHISVLPLRMEPQLGPNVLFAVNSELGFFANSVAHTSVYQHPFISILLSVTLPENIVLMVYFAFTYGMAIKDGVTWTNYFLNFQVSVNQFSFRFSNSEKKSPRTLSWWCKISILKFIRLFTIHLEKTHHQSFVLIFYFVFTCGRAIKNGVTWTNYLHFQVSVNQFSLRFSFLEKKQNQRPFTLSWWSKISILKFVFIYNFLRENTSPELPYNMVICTQ